MRLVTNEVLVREATASDTVVEDTATMSKEGLDALLERLLTEKAGLLVMRLEEEHPELFGGVPDRDSNNHQTSNANQPIAEHVGANTGDWLHDNDIDPDFGVPRGGLVEVKEIYPSGSSYEGLPGLVSTVDTWLHNLQQYLHDVGIAPDSPVAWVEAWHAQAPHTHYEAGAIVAGVYAKFDLTAGGYRLIFNAVRPEAGSRFSHADVYDLNGATALSLYQTFLTVAQTNGPYAEGSNDCHRFAMDLCTAMGGQKRPEVSR
jgi:hypothetical protein